MWAYDDRRGRGTRDIPPSSSARYYDSIYANTNPGRTSSRYQDVDPPPPPASTAAYDRHHQHRRKSVPVNLDEGRPSHSHSHTHSRRANVVASDDGRGSRDAYGSVYPERSSRHDAEAKTSDGHRRFREKRGGYETEEALNLRRAKSYSPRRAAREAEAPRHASPQAPPKSNWGGAGDGDDTDDYGAGLRRSATTGKKGRGQQYYEDDPRLGVGGSKTRDRGARGGGYEYATAPAPATEMPRPPLGDYSPYKSSPLSSSSRGSDEKVGKHRGRDRDPRGRDPEPTYYGSGYTPYEPEPQPSRHGRHSSRAAEDPSRVAGSGVAGWDDDDKGYSTTAAAAAAPPRDARSRHRPPPPPADDYDDQSAYDRPIPRQRHRSSMPPPQARSRYQDGGAGGAGYDDPYAAGPVPPRQRAASMSQPRRYDTGAGGYGGGVGGADYPRDRKGGYYDDPRSSNGAGGATASSGKKTKGKQIHKQAGKLFMTHAFPVIKQEAVPFLTKAAQAYFDNRK